MLSYKSLKGISAKLSFFILKLSLLIAYIYLNPTHAACETTTNLQYVLSGLDEDAKKNVMARFANFLKGKGPHFTTQEIVHFYKEAPSEIKKGIAPFGYFNPTIHSVLLKRGPSFIAYFNVRPGVPVRIKSLAITITGMGFDTAALKSVVKELPLKEGAIFNVPHYSEAKLKLFETAKEEGYLKASFENKILIDKHQHTAQIIIHLKTGHRYYFGHFFFETHPYAESFMQRFLYLCPGSVFRSRKLLKNQEDMEKSYYFKRVVFRPEIDQARHYQVPVYAQLFAPKPLKYSLGLGYGTFTGVRVSAGLSLRHLGEYGEHLEAQLRLSSILGVIGVNYYIPGANPLTDEWVVGANYKKFNPKYGKSDSITFTGGYNTRFDKLRLNTSLNFLYERYYAFRPPSIHAHLLYPRFYLTYINADNIITPHQGIMLSFDLDLGAKPLLSTTSFIKTTIRGKAVVSPFGFCRIIGRGALGVVAVKNLYRFPLSMRYFAGGINTLRGFPDSSIGPGKYLDIGSLEYQQRLKGDWYAALFYDVGSASNHFHSPINRGAGVGVVYDSIIGGIRFYVSRAISKRGMPHSVEFSIGPEFS